MRQQERIKGHLFNVIVYTHEPERSSYFHLIVNPFIEEYPCRVIFIEGDLKSEREYLDINPIDPAEDHRHCDQLNIRASSSRLSQVPFVLLPHLIPDLPIYLVWGQDPVSDLPILPRLQKLATRFIYDSACTKNFSAFSKKILDNIDRKSMDVMDIAWAKIGGWRDVIAQTFHSREKLDFLKRCNQILIKYNPPDDIEALYLHGWMAARLQWNYQSLASDEHAQIIYYTNNDHPLKVTFFPQKRPTLRLGRIFEIAFETIDHTAITLSLAEKQGKVMVYLSTPEKCELPYSFPIADLEKRHHAMKEIFYHRTSDHYRHLLQLIGEIKGKEL
ncbi:MAG: glucose-6-phosphate dehydrogenase assembly protein OpcA [Waddliaceae bacterium]